MRAAIVNIDMRLGESEMVAATMARLQVLDRMVAYSDSGHD